MTDARTEESDQRHEAARQIAQQRQRRADEDLVELMKLDRFRRFARWFVHEFGGKGKPSFTGVGQDAGRRLTDFNEGYRALAGAFEIKLLQVAPERCCDMDAEHVRERQAELALATKINASAGVKSE